MRPRLARWIGALVAAAILFAGYRLIYAPREGAFRPAPIWHTGHPQTFDQAVRRLREEVAVDERRAVERGDDWLSLQNAAAARLSIARLTGDMAELGKASADLASAFEIAVPGAGPHHLLATLELAAHRLGRAEAALAATERYAMPEPNELRGDAIGMRGDIALYRGDYGHALGHYEVAEKLAGPIIACRTANLYAWLGRTSGALKAVDRCEAGQAMRTPQFAAAIDLQRGIIQLRRGRLEDASAAFTRADRTFPGDWRIEMRLAQVAALKGNIPGAIGAFEGIAARTGNPEPMDVLAGLYRARGDRKASRAWANRAATGWRLRLANNPEAVWAHLAEHELAFGQPMRALGYAARNVRSRPYAESLLVLAKAWLANGRADYAAALASKVNRSGWQSVEQHVVAADALALLGKGDEAAAERDFAERLNPLAGANNPAFAWLDH